MYLVKFRIDKSAPTVRRALSDRQTLHSSIQSVFHTDRQSSNVLYRINNDSLYVSSDKMPGDIKDFGFVSGHELKPIEGVHRFSIVTIPRKTVGNKKHILGTEEERLKWLRTQGAKNGFEVLSSHEVSRESVVSKRKGFKVTAFRYDGILNVTDLAKFNAARLKGIGPMKAYGCGLLLVV